MAYFTKDLTLKEMVDHIYGRANVIETKNRPHMFIKELAMYVDYFSNKVDEFSDSFNAKNQKYLTAFQTNLNEGIEYYQQLFSESKIYFESNKESLLNELETLRTALFDIKIPILVKA
jgi:hypothetical protein